jgi:hypothetical protein
MWKRHSKKLQDSYCEQSEKNGFFLSAFFLILFLCDLFCRGDGSKNKSVADSGTVKVSGGEDKKGSGGCC